METQRLAPAGWADPGLSGGSVVKDLPADAGDAGLIPESGRSPREGREKRQRLKEENKNDWRTSLVVQ